MVSSRSHRIDRWNMVRDLDPLHIALKDGFVEAVSQYLSQGVDVNQQMVHLRLTMLHVASTGSSLEMVKMLVDAGADVNSRNKTGKTPLMLACYFGQQTIGKYLMEKGAEVNMHCHLDRTPLMYAIGIKPCGVSLVSELLQAGACVNDCDDFGHTPLHSTVSHWGSHFGNNKWKIQQLLLNYPCDIDAPDEDGCTALHLAAEYDDLNAAMMLIKAGCQMNIEDDSALTPVFYAIRHNNYNVLEMFLAAGARITASAWQKVNKRVLKDPIKWERVLALCAEFPRLSRMCRRTFYDHYGTEAKNRIEKLPLPH